MLKSLLANNERSYCDYCGKQLSWKNNIPVFSWIFQGGKTSCCHNKLPVSYPLIELGSGFLFFYYFVFFYGKVDIRLWVVGIPILLLMMFSSWFDYLYLILPDFTSYALVLLAGISLIWRMDRIEALISGAISCGFIYLLTRVRIHGKEAMGDGDVPLATFLGLWLGFPGTVIAFYVAFIVGAIVGVILMLLGNKDGDDHIPFGPFLILGTLVAWWWGPIIVEAIFRFLQ